MNNLQKVQDIIDVYYSYYDLVGNPTALAVNTKNGAKIYFIWQDENEDLYCVNDIQRGVISPVPSESFSDFMEAKAYLDSL